MTKPAFLTPEIESYVMAEAKKASDRMYKRMRALRAPRMYGLILMAGNNSLKNFRLKHGLAPKAIYVLILTDYLMKERKMFSITLKDVKPFLTINYRQLYRVLVYLHEHGYVNRQKQGRFSISQSGSQLLTNFTQSVVAYFQDVAAKAQKQ